MKMMPTPILFLISFSPLYESLMSLDVLVIMSL